MYLIKKIDRLYSRFLMEYFRKKLKILKKRKKVTRKIKNLNAK